MSRRVLVTGGAGFIGRHLVAALVARGDDVLVLDNFSRSSPEAVPPGARVVAGDIRDSETVARACAGRDLVYHLAAQSNVLGAVQDSDYSVTTNVIGTANVVREAGRAGVRRLLFSSSREVYGDPLALPVSETAPLRPKNGYGASKLAGEAFVHAGAAGGLAEAVILRFGNVYGPGDHGRVIPLWVAAAASGAPLRVFGGKQVIDFVPVATAVQALLAAETCPSRAIVNVASGRGTAILDLARRLVATARSISKIEVLPARTVEVVEFIAATRRMRDVLGLAPPVDPLEGLDAMVAAEGRAEVSPSPASA